MTYKAIPLTCVVIFRADCVLLFSAATAAQMTPVTSVTGRLGVGGVSEESGASREAHHVCRRLPLSMRMRDGRAALHFLLSILMQTAGTQCKGRGHTGKLFLPLRVSLLMLQSSVHI